MKKIFLLIIFLGGILRSYSQTTPAKQDIINWVTEKIKNCCPYEGLNNRTTMLKKNELQIALDEKKEANINNRMAKALNDLGGYNCPKAKDLY